MLYVSPVAPCYVSHGTMLYVCASNGPVLYMCVSRGPMLYAYVSRGTMLFMCVSHGPVLCVCPVAPCSMHVSRATGHICIQHRAMGHTHK